MKKVRAVTFDVGNTLLYCDPPPPEIYATALSRLGRRVDGDEVAPVFSSAWAEMQQRTVPGKDRYSSIEGGERAWWGQFVRTVLARLDHDAPWQQLLDDLYAAFSVPDVWRLFPDTVPTIEALGARGLSLGVISNWDRRLPELLRDLHLAEYFDVVTVSALVGIEKPEAAIFTGTLEQMGVEAGFVIHVGDSPREDFGGAEAAGLCGVLVDRRGLFDRDAYRCVDRLDELLNMIDGAEDGWQQASEKEATCDMR